MSTGFLLQSKHIHVKATGVTFERVSLCVSAVMSKVYEASQTVLRRRAVSCCNRIAAHSVAAAYS